jgi:hypothetical protein
MTSSPGATRIRFGTGRALLRGIAFHARKQRRSYASKTATISIDLGSTITI